MPPNNRRPRLNPRLSLWLPPKRPRTSRVHQNQRRQPTLASKPRANSPHSPVHPAKTGEIALNRHTIRDAARRGGTSRIGRAENSSGVRVGRIGQTAVNTASSSTTGTINSGRGVATRAT